MSSSATAKVINHKLVVVVAAFAAFLATFNETYLNVAFTPIMLDLGVGVSTVQWLATAYMLGAAVMVPVSAFLYRSVPTRRLFLITVSFLIVGSVISALAGSFPLLLAGRIVQAVGTGMLIPIGMNITLEVAPREKLGVYMGIMGAMTTLGPSLSVIAAGVLLSFFNWHKDHVRHTSNDRIHMEKMLDERANIGADKNTGIYGAVCNRNAQGSF